MYFHTRWKDYVDATKVNGKERVVQLLYLTRSCGGLLANKTEEAVFKAMRSLAVREENTKILYSMTQDRNETIRSSAARLRQVSVNSQFSVLQLAVNELSLQEVDMTTKYNLIYFVIGIRT